MQYLLLKYHNLPVYFDSSFSIVTVPKHFAHKTQRQHIFKLQTPHLLIDTDYFAHARNRLLNLTRWVQRHTQFLVQKCDFLAEFRAFIDLAFDIDGFSK